MYNAASLALMLKISIEKLRQKILASDELYIGKSCLQNASSISN